MSPEYFLDRMTLPEADAFLEGWEERRREQWERVRSVCHAVIQSQSTKPLDPEDVMRFPWDNDRDTEEASPEDWERTRAEARRILEQRKSNGDKQ